MLNNIIREDNLLKEKIYKMPFFKRHFFSSYLDKSNVNMIEVIIILLNACLSFSSVFIFSTIFNYFLPDRSFSISVAGMFMSVLMMPILFHSFLKLQTFTENKIFNSIRRRLYDSYDAAIAELNNIEEHIYKKTTSTALLIAQLETKQIVLNNLYCRVKSSLMSKIDEKIDYLKKLNAQEGNIYKNDDVYMSEENIEEILTSDAVSGDWLIRNLDINYAPIKDKLHLIDADKIIHCHNNEKILALLAPLSLEQFKELPVDTRQKLVMQKNSVIF